MAVKVAPRYPHVVVNIDLRGPDGNVFNVLGAVNAALRRAGVSPAIRNEFQREAMSGDYEHALATCDQWVKFVAIGRPESIHQGEETEADEPDDDDSAEDDFEIDPDEDEPDDDEGEEDETFDDDEDD